MFLCFHLKKVCGTVFPFVINLIPWHFYFSMVSVLNAFSFHRYLVLYAYISFFVIIPMMHHLSVLDLRTYGWQAVKTLDIGMELADRAVGFLLCLISLSVFTYYTFWVIILPFVDTDHFIHNYFLPQEYAILIPVFAGVVLLSFLSVFIGLVMLQSKKKKAWSSTLFFFFSLSIISFCVIRPRFWQEHRFAG